MYQYPNRFHLLYHVVLNMCVNFLTLKECRCVQSGLNDPWGRVAAISFGPRHVVLLVGRNKIVIDLGEAMERIKNFAAPANAIRHPGFNPPCVRSACCMDCRSYYRICNNWSITERSFI